MSQPSLQIEATLEKALIAKEHATRRVVEIKLQAPATQRKQEQRMPLNLGLVIDRSGSMQGEKIEYVKQAARHVIGMLKADDRAGLFIYDNIAETVMPNVELTEENRAHFLSAIDEVFPRGMTNLSDGWLMGCEAVARHMADNQVNRVLLLSDGLANQGITSLEELGQHAAALHERGIATSTFGVGVDFSEQLLERMSSQGGGNFYFIEHPRHIPEIFLAELQELVQVTAKGAELRCLLPAGATVEVLGGWRHQIQEGQLRVFLGDLVALQERAVYLILNLPPQSEPGKASVTFSLHARGEDGSEFSADTTAVFEYAGLAACENAPYHAEMMARYGKVHLSDTTREALLLERMGKRDQAQAVMASAMEGTAHYLRAEDRQLFTNRSERMRDGLSEEERKRMHYNTYRRSRDRNIDDSEEQNEV
ncbi:MAG: VWA domain-containing protein [Anaerolineae bacterium]|nr:VWA domain-containing protein [Anaerolineae bacterium]